MNGAVLLGLMVPFVGTALGAMMVVFVKSEMNHNMQRAFTGFAAGVMVSASFFSLLIPAVSQASETMGKKAVIPTTIGFCMWICSFWLRARALALWAAIFPCASFCECKGGVSNAQRKGYAHGASSSYGSAATVCSVGLC